MHHRRHFACNRRQLQSALRSTRLPSWSTSASRSPLPASHPRAPHTPQPSTDPHRTPHPNPTPTHIEPSLTPQAAAELQPLCQSLPQLLHHRAAVLRILLSSLVPAARLSLPALLDLLASAARDLQAEFLPALPRVVRRLVALLDGGAEREPEVGHPGGTPVWSPRCRPVHVGIAARGRATVRLVEACPGHPGFGPWLATRQDVKQIVTLFLSVLPLELRSPWRPSSRACRTCASTWSRTWPPTCPPRCE